MHVVWRPTAGDHGFFTAEDAEDAEVSQRRRGSGRAGAVKSSVQPALFSAGTAAPTPPLCVASGSSASSAVKSPWSPVVGRPATRMLACGRRLLVCEVVHAHCHHR